MSRTSEHFDIGKDFIKKKNQFQSQDFQNVRAL